ncbi:spore germination protein [Neobacillus notoginsengisoli]|uniref:Spore germination protein n=1 Tax=Neobacillus notoginsengisoli TaxID=1578198 RepID=A0A417YZE1_9BACI|nr:spore germination protein [Neobacillus notoginsengisoli]RHW43166.1 spore germination protein [Neobacillus notoginsengisoli]
MPAIVGAVQVIALGTSAVFNIGDVYSLSPISSAKTFSGAGSFNTGEAVHNLNHLSSTNVYDTDGIDQPIAFNV